MTALDEHAHPDQAGAADTAADTGLGPLRKEIEVACAPDRAFEVFTRMCGEWWPLSSHSVYGEDAAGVSFGSGVGGEIIETSATGEACSWGTITTWEPGHRLAFDWHPGMPLTQTTRVEVTFTPTAAGTLVELVHSGWEHRDQPASRRAGYDVGWIPVMIRYAALGSGIAL